MNDKTDKLLDQWAQERPDLDCSGLDVVVRVQDAAKLLRRNEDGALQNLELKMWEYDVLSALRRQGDPYELAATDLAREALLSAGAMTNRIDRLEDKGLVQREPDPADARTVRVKLTPAGRALVDEAVEARLKVADQQVAKLSQEERRILSVGLRKLISAAA